MAYFLKNQNEDENQQYGNQNQMSGGNIYSTSGSEVSSTSGSAPTSNSNNSSNTKSNESGNWVNLNKYLDANQGKVSGYVDNLANPYTSQVDSYKSSLDSNKNKYMQDVNNQTANKLNTNESKGVVSNYLLNSNSVDDSSWSKVQDTLKGYTGPSQYSLTGDEYNYSKDRKTADDFNDFGSNFSNQDYRMSLMGNDISSGGKKLNNFLLGTSDAKNKIADYSTQFKDLAALLDQNSQDMDSAYNNAVGVANQSKEDLESNVAAIKAQQQKALEDRYKQEQANAERKKNDKKEQIEYYNYPYTNRDGKTFYIRIPVRKNWVDTSSNAAINKGNELTELDQRANDLLTGNRTGSSSLDLDNLGFGNYVSRSNDTKLQAGKKIQDALNLDNSNRDLVSYSNSGILDALFAPATTNDLLNIFDPNNSLDDEYNATGQDLLDSFINDKINEREFYNTLLLLTMLREVPNEPESRDAVRQLRNELNKL